MGRTLTVRYDNLSDKDEKALSAPSGAPQPFMYNGHHAGGMIGSQSGNLYGPQGMNMGGQFGSSGMLSSDEHFLSCLSARTLLGEICVVILCLFRQGFSTVADVIFSVM
jgi:hypothetical protein